MKIHVMCVGYTLMTMITKKLGLDVTVIVTNVDVGSIIGVQDLTKKQILGRSLSVVTAEFHVYLYTSHHGITFRRVCIVLSIVGILSSYFVIYPYITSHK